MDVPENPKTNFNVPGSKAIFPSRKPVGDILPGSLSSSMLLAAFAIVGTRAELLARIFGNDYNAHYRESGLLVLELYRSYAWSEVVLDICLPTDILLKNPETWGCYLEKAFAKTLGGYARLAKAYEGARGYEKAVAELTGGVIEPCGSVAGLEWGVFKKKCESGNLLSVWFEGADAEKREGRGRANILNTPHSRYAPCGSVAGLEWGVFKKKCGNLLSVWFEGADAEKREGTG